MHFATYATHLPGRPSSLAGTLQHLGLQLSGEGTICGDPQRLFDVK